MSSSFTRVESSEWKRLGTRTSDLIGKIRELREQKREWKNKNVQGDIPRHIFILDIAKDLDGEVKAWASQFHSVINNSLKNLISYYMEWLLDNPKPESWTSMFTKRLKAAHNQSDDAKPGAFTDPESRGLLTTLLNSVEDPSSIEIEKEDFHAVQEILSVHVKSIENAFKHAWEHEIQEGLKSPEELKQECINFVDEWDWNRVRQHTRKLVDIFADEEGKGAYNSALDSLDDKKENHRSKFEREAVKQRLNSMLNWTEYVRDDSVVEEFLEMLNGNFIVSLTGPGGIGKTALAAEIIRAHMNINYRNFNKTQPRNYDYFPILTTKDQSQGEYNTMPGVDGEFGKRDPTDPQWSPAYYIGGRNPFEKFVKELSRCNKEYDPTDSVDEHAIKALEALVSERILLVLDNYEDIENTKNLDGETDYIKFNKFLNAYSRTPVELKKSKIIITSRLQGVGAEHIVQPLSDQEADDLLMTRMVHLTAKYGIEPKWDVWTFAKDLRTKGQLSKLFGDLSDEVEGRYNHPLVLMIIAYKLMKSEPPKSRDSFLSEFFEGFNKQDLYAWIFEKSVKLIESESADFQAFKHLLKKKKSKFTLDQFLAEFKRLHNRDHPPRKEAKMFLNQLIGSNLLNEISSESYLISPQTLKGLRSYYDMVDEAVESTPPLQYNTTARKKIADWIVEFEQARDIKDFDTLQKMAKSLISLWNKMTFSDSTQQHRFDDVLAFEKLAREIISTYEIENQTKPGDIDTLEQSLQGGLIRYWKQSPTKIPAKHVENFLTACYNHLNSKTSTVGDITEILQALSEFLEIEGNQEQISEFSHSAYLLLILTNFRILNAKSDESTQPLRLWCRIFMQFYDPEFSPAARRHWLDSKSLAIAGKMLVAFLTNPNCFTNPSRSKRIDTLSEIYSVLDDEKLRDEILIVLAEEGAEKILLSHGTTLGELRVGLQVISRNIPWIHTASGRWEFETTDTIFLLKGQYDELPEIFASKIVDINVDEVTLEFDHSDTTVDDIKELIEKIAIRQVESLEIEEKHIAQALEDLVPDKKEEAILNSELGLQFKARLGIAGKTLASQIGIQGGFKGLIIHFLGNRAIFLGSGEFTKVYKDDTAKPLPIISDSPPSESLGEKVKQVIVEAPPASALVLSQPWARGGFAIPNDPNDVIEAARTLADIANRPDFIESWTPSIRLEMRDLALREILDATDLPMYREVMANVIWKMLYHAEKSILGPLLATDFVDNYENSLRSGRRKPLSEDSELAEAFAGYFSEVRSILEEQMAKSESLGQDAALEPMHNPEVWSACIELIKEKQTQLEEPTFQQIKEILKQKVGTDFKANAKQKNRIWVSFWESLQSSPNSVIPTLSEHDWRMILLNYNSHKNADTDWSPIFRIIPAKPTTCPECGSKEFDKDHQDTWSCRVCGMLNHLD